MGRKPSVMSYEQAVKSLPIRIVDLEKEAAILRAKAQDMMLEATRLEAEHFDAVRPVSCDTCGNARKGTDGIYRDRGWASKACMACKRPGFSEWKRRHSTREV